MGTEKRERQRANRQAKLQEVAKRQATVKRKKVTLRWGVIILAVVAGIILLSRQLVKDEKASTTTVPAETGLPGETTTTAARVPTTTIPFSFGTTDCPMADGSSPKTQKFSAPFKLCIDPAKAYVATIETNKGTYTAQLDAVRAPGTVNNFVSLARFHYFDDTPCHRVIKAFMAQCGDPDGTGTGGPGYGFADELPASEADYVPGTLAMANSGPGTNGSQFFTMFRNGLAPSYSVFGSVTEGLDTTIKALDAIGNPTDGAPTEPVKIVKVTITES